MKANLFFIALIFAPYFLFSQDMEGNWYGNIEITGSTLPIEIHCEHPVKGPFLLYSRQQTNKAFAIKDWKIENGVWTWEVPKLRVQYEGKWMENEQIFKGEFRQNGMRASLNLSKTKEAILPLSNAMAHRPQTPLPPFDYPVEEIVFNSVNEMGEEVQWAGTLSLPKGDGPFPCLLMITGSGPQDRDETIMDHKPFAVLADTLAKLGWATFRYDERGVGSSSGDFSSATTVNFAADAKSIFALLKQQRKLDANKIGLLGHSEGSLVSAMVASGRKDVYCIVSMAGPGVSGKELLERQSMDIQMSTGKSRSEAQLDVDFNSSIMEYILQESDSLKIAAFIHGKIAEPDQKPKSTEDAVLEGTEIFDEYNTSFNNVWMRSFVRSHPEEFWQKVQCPVLILNGDSDLQVNADVNTKAIYAACPFNSNTEITILSNHNHLFQYTETGRISEYGILTETLSPETIESITEWLKKLP